MQKKGAEKMKKKKFYCKAFEMEKNALFFK